ncbi:VPS9 domain-containing protein 1-like [Tubulanus polymorphus]|uniref:VPS9 domain-containing protein 1-like n=1 Tax=Tubulanus polymorphus TaxID=672921 RepID=UPI003DA33A1E
MSTLLNDNIHPAMRHVADAIRQDSENNREAAYYKYLLSMQFIIYNLLEDYKYQGSISVDCVTKKFVKLGQQCMDRIHSLIQNPDTGRTSVNNNSQTDSVDLHSSAMHRSCSSSSIALNPTATSTSSSASTTVTDLGRSFPNVPLTQFPSPSASPTASRPAIFTNDVPRNLRPVYYAQQQNDYLLSAHKQRLAHVNSNRNTTEMNLRLQRRLIENAALARSKQAALEKKTRERLKLIEAEAIEKFSSKEDQEFYKSVLKYEELAEWPLAWRARVNGNPTDSRLIHLLVQQILRYPEHPITKLMMTYQYNIYDKISPLITKHLENLQSIRVPYLACNDKDSINKTSQNLNETTNSSKSAERHADQVVPDSVGEEADLRADVPDNRESEVCQTETDSGDRLLSADESKPDSPISDQNSNIEDNEKSTTCSMSAAEAKRSNFKQMFACSESEDFDDLFENQWEYVDCTGKESVNVSHRLSVNDEAKITALDLKAFQKHAQDIVKDIHLYYNKTLHLFTIAYSQWNNPDTKETLLEEIEEPYYKPLWPYILALFRVNNQNKEIQLAKVMTKYIQAGPEMFEVNDDVCLLECNVGESRFMPVCEELRRIAHCTCPTKKLLCLVNFSRMICHSVEEISRFRSDSIGADDLLPIICYLVNSSGSPFIWSECIALEEFIPQRILYGEEGYCLTSVQTAMGYLMTLDTSNT